MTQQPEALRLADRLDLYATGDAHQRDIEQAAAELRRLQELHELYQDKAQRQQARITTLEAALRQAVEAMGTVGADLVCEASHHEKKNRHAMGEECPLQQRWHIAFTTAKQALGEES